MGTNNNRTAIHASCRVNVQREMGIDPEHGTFHDGHAASYVCKQGGAKRGMMVATSLFVTFTVLMLMYPREGIEQEGGPAVQLKKRGVVISKDTVEVCSTPACQSASDLYLQYLDKDVKPCEDFYKFTCGKWEHSYHLPNGKARIDTLNLVADEAKLLVREILEGNHPPVLEGSTEEDKCVDRQLFDKARGMYRACMDEVTIAKRGMAPLINVASKFLTTFPENEPDGGGIDRSKLMHALIELHAMGDASLVHVSVGDDDLEPRKQVIFIGQGGLTLFLPSYSDPQHLNTLCSAIKDVMTKLYGAREPHKKSWEAIAAEVVDFEKRVAAIMWPKVKMDDPFAIYNPSKLDEFQARAQVLAWRQFILGIAQRAGVSIDSKLIDRVVVRTPSYLYELDAIVQATRPEVLNAFLALRAMHEHLDLVDKETRDVFVELRQLKGDASSEPPRWDTCVQRVDHYIGFASTARWFVARKLAGNPSPVPAAQDMINRIVTTYEKRFDEVDWLDGNARRTAHSKLKAITHKIGFPEDLRNATKLWTGLQHVRGSVDDHFGNIQSAKLNNIARGWASLSKPTDRNEWRLRPQQANAWYMWAKNEITFPLAILMPPLFDPRLPSSLNYGGMVGMLGGHEISHGFDTNGRLYDDKGILRDWWTEATSAAFQERAQCFENQYSRHSVPNPQGGAPLAVNGRMTRAENIADNGGLRQSWHAWQALRNETTEWGAAGPGHAARLPGLREYSPEQMFYIAFGRSWCDKATEQSTVWWMRNEEHTIGSARVNAVVQNSPEFALAFQCAVGSPMNPERKCSIW